MLLHPKNPKRKLILITASAILILVGLTLFVLDRESSGNREYACTLEAKQCPDGSFVGRVGPDCQFEACPGE